MSTNAKLILVAIGALLAGVLLFSLAWEALK